MSNEFGANIIFYFNGNSDILHIDLASQDANVTNIKGDYNKYFKIPLVEFDNEIMEIPNPEYDAEFSIAAKKMCEIILTLNALKSKLI